MGFAGKLVAHPLSSLAKGVGVVLLLAVAVVLVAGFVMPLPGEKQTPSGLKRNTSQYVEMSDGTRIAIDVWLPENHQTGQRLPTLTRMTRYWRTMEHGFLARVMINLGLAGAFDNLSSTQIFNEEGYVNVLIDARGTGASFGSRKTVFSPQEAADYGEVVDWIVAQPWSNGRVGAYGVSYEGNTAELLTVNNNPAVKAVAQLYSNFDAQFGLIQPGGLKLTWINQWESANALLDSNDICGVSKLFSDDAPNCMITKLFVSGVKPVDGQDGHELLEAAVSSRQNDDLSEAFNTMEYRDDIVGRSGLTVEDVSPLGLQTMIEASQTPMYVWTGWNDSATSNGALERYLKFSNEQSVVIGPFSHGGGLDADPYAPVDQEVQPSRANQYVQLVRNFFDCHLKDSGCIAPAAKGIRYFTMGEGVWRSSQSWPPAHVAPERFFLRAENALSQSPPTEDAGEDRYRVDFSHSTGTKIRWNAGLGGDIIYNGYRGGSDARILSYQTEPLEHDVEITGSPVITLQVASTHEDGAFHAYLEDVAPDGAVTYITEGVIRAKNRKVSSADPVVEKALGPQFSFLKADVQPLEPGVMTKITFPFYSTSVLVRRGHRLRLSLAGADASMFLRLPASGDPEWTVSRSSSIASYVDIPLSVRQ